MTDRHQERAEKVVATFKALLDASVQEHISDAQFEHLAIAIREALAEEVHDVARQLEELARGLRAATDREEREL